MERAEVPCRTTDELESVRREIDRKEVPEAASARDDSTWATQGEAPP